MFMYRYIYYIEDDENQSQYRQEIPINVRVELARNSLISFGAPFATSAGWTDDDANVRGARNVRRAKLPLVPMAQVMEEFTAINKAHEPRSALKMCPTVGFVAKIERARFW